MRKLFQTTNYLTTLNVLLKSFAYWCLKMHIQSDGKKLYFQCPIHLTFPAPSMLNLTHYVGVPCEQMAKFYFATSNSHQHNEPLKKYNFHRCMQSNNQKSSKLSHEFEIIVISSFVSHHHKLSKYLWQKYFYYQSISSFVHWFRRHFFWVPVEFP